MMSRKRFGMRKGLAVLLAGVCALTAVGCGNGAGGSGENGTDKAGQADGNENSNAKGRYMEEQKEMPEGVGYLNDMVRLSDGELALVDAMSGTIHVSQDNGDSWEEKKVSSAVSLLDTGGEITSMAVDSSGGVFFSYIDWGSVGTSGDSSEDEGTSEADDSSDAFVVSDDTESPISDYQECYKYVSADGTEKDLPLKIKAQNNRLEQAVFAGDDSLYVMDFDGGVYAIDMEQAASNEIFSLENNLHRELCASGDYVIGVGSDTAVFYQISTGEQQEDDETFNDFVSKELSDVSSRFRLTMDKDGKTVYSASKSGLYSHVLGGSTMEELLNGGLCTLGDPTKDVAAVLANEDGTFDIAYTDGEADHLTYDPEASTVPEQQITVYSLNSNDTVNKAISSFRKNHPEVYVKNEIGLTGDNGVTSEDAIRNLNTKLLAGEGPDIILLDGMPVDSYVEKGILADLSDVAADLKKDGNYFTNILEAYKGENGLYAMPVRFTVPMIIGDKATLKQMKDLNTFADAVEKERENNPEIESILGTYTAEELLKVLALTSASAWMKGNELDTNALTDFLTQAEKIYQVEHKNITDAMVQEHEEQLARIAAYGINRIAEELTDAQLSWIMMKVQSMGAGYVSGMDGMKAIASFSENKENGASRLMPGQMQQVFCPSGLVGMNQNTKEKEVAESFLIELFGEKVQQSDLQDGFPVNADAYDSFTENPRPEIYEGYSMSAEDGEEVSINVVWPAAEDIAAFKETIGELHTPSLQAGTLVDVVLESGQKVLEGDITVEEGVNEIAQKMELMFAE